MKRYRNWAIEFYPYYPQEVESIREDDEFEDRRWGIIAERARKAGNGPVPGKVWEYFNKRIRK